MSRATIASPGTDEALSLPQTARRRSWPSEIGAVFLKDLRSEFRTRSALFAILLFAMTALVVVSFTIRPIGLGLTVDREFREVETEMRRLLLSAVLWLILFFSAMSGLARSFVKEEDARTALALRLAARPLAVYFGKLVFNVALLLAVAAIVTPFFLIFFQPAVGNGGLLLAEVVFGCATMAATVTILGAIVARAGSGSALFTALAFPLLLFVLVLAIRGTAGALAGGSESVQARNQLPALVSYMVAMITASAMLFEHVWKA
jgi:heme exporter protein B